MENSFVELRVVTRLNATSACILHANSLLSERRDVLESGWCALWNRSLSETFKCCFHVLSMHKYRYRYIYSHLYLYMVQTYVYS